jgi:predicted transposase YdaD
MADLRTLTPKPNSFIDEKLKAQEADLVYSVQINGEEGYFFILCEHQSYPDKMMPVILNLAEDADF